MANALLWQALGESLPRRTTERLLGPLAALAAFLAAFCLLLAWDALDRPRQTGPLFAEVAVPMSAEVTVFCTARVVTGMQVPTPSPRIAMPVDTNVRLLVVSSERALSMTSAALGTLP